ncbi:MAG: hypothetical protein HYZ29_10210 [Myxococcales bacterium]|nr:hypothetical protein [Myxococcales bacterium]
MHSDDDELTATAKALEAAEERADTAKAAALAAGESAPDPTLLTVRRAILSTLAADPKADDPVNALIVWTELGRALSGTLDDVAAGAGYIKKLTSAWFETQGAEAGVDLRRFIYRVDEERRLQPAEIKRLAASVEAAIEQGLPELAHAAHEGAGGRQALFLAVVKGWFPVGLELFQALPAGQTSSEAEVLGAFWAWCLKYLPDDRPDGPGALLSAGAPPRGVA